MQYKAPNINFIDYVAFTKGDTDDKFFYDIPNKDMHKFDDYNGFSTSLGAIIFGPNYVYTATCRLISRILAVTDIIKTVCNVTTLVC